MLISLAINNLALVKHLTLDFASGFTSISGETGAGKSLVIFALGLVLGDKPRNLENDNCQITAEFVLANDSLAARWLEEQQLAETQQDKIALLVRRSISNKRSKAFINGVQVGVSELAQLGDMLLSLHSQHQHHALLRRTYQREMLDDFAGADELVKEVAHLYTKSKQLRKSLQESTEKQQRIIRELELVRHHLDELDAFGPQQDEYTKLEQLHRQASRRQHIQELLSRLLSNLEGQGEQLGYITSLQKIGRELASLKITDFNEFAEVVESASTLLEEVASTAHRHMDNDPDGTSFAELEERISGYHQLARKHQCKAESLFELHASLGEQKNQLVSQAQGQEVLQQQLAENENQLVETAKKLSHTRSEAAQKLQHTINALLPELAMSDAQFSVALEKLEQPVSEGYEQPIFLLQTNKGGKMLPLKDIASGGELSRASLALYLACNENTSPMTMVFDEVDSGLSGEVSARVGQILKQLAHRHQVLCITHQPQLVALADNHLAVRKHTTADSTSITVVPLDATDAVTEIARMLGGVEKTSETSQQLAYDMYQQGRDF